MALHESAPSTRPAIGRAALLVAGDALALLVFATIGRASHGEASGLAALAQTVETAAPFVVGWFAITPFAGLYRADIADQPRRMLPRLALAWLVAWPIGLGLRALIRQSGIPLSFALVTFISVLVIMAAWRGIYALIAARRA